MALTADQSTALQTAIDNLNSSVQVNKEVLEIVRSTGNTGAVDIAEHNNNLDAHPVFNKLYANAGVQVGGDSADAYASKNAALKLESTSSSVSVDAYRNVDRITSPFLIRCVSFRDNSAAIEETNLGHISIQARERDSASSFKTLSRLDLSESTDRGQYIRAGVLNEGTSQNLYYNFFNSAFATGTPVDLGESAYQWKDAYLQNSPIVSSDRRLKQNFETVPEAVFKAWASVNFQVYKFKEAVEKKGEATARKHVGLVAQDIIEAFEAQGLNAFDYGIVCHDEWEDQYVDEQVIDSEAVYDKDGKLVTPEKSHTEKRFVKAAGDVYTVRYEEALALEAAYQRWKLGKIEQALAAKGITL